MAKRFPVPGLALCALLLIGLALGCEGEESTTRSSDSSDDDGQSAEQSALVPGLGSGDDSQSAEQSALVPGLIPGQTTADPAVTPSPTPVALPPGYYDGAEHGLALAQTSRRPSPNREGWVDITLSLVAVKLGGGQLGLERGESNSLCFSFGDCFLVKWGSEEQFEAELRVAFERGSGDTGPHGPRGPKSVNLTATFQVAGNAGNANLYFGDHKIPLDLQGDYSLSANHASPLPAPAPLASQDPKTANFFMDAEHGIAVTGVYRQVDPAEPLHSWVRVELEVLPLGGYDAPDAEGGLHVEAGSVCLGNDDSECLEIFWGPKNQFNAPLSLDRDDNRAFVEARRSGARWPLPLTVGFRAPHNQDDAELMFGEHSIPLDLRGMTGDPAFDYTAHYPGAMSGALLYESDGKTVVLDSITQNPDTGNPQLALIAKNDNEAEDFTPAVDTAVFSTVGKLDVTGGRRPVAFETMAPGQSASLATVIPYAGNAQWGYVIYSSESPRRPDGIVVQVREDGGAQSSTPVFISFGGMALTGSWPPPPVSAPISNGDYHTCALREDGSAVCWGSDDEGQASPPAGETFAALSSGDYHTCALREDGSAVCWGSDDEGQASPPTGETFAAISSGGSHTCALRADRTAVCWGYDEDDWGWDDEGQASPPEGETFAALSSGYLHTCALREDGTAVCWGSDRDGRASPPAGETFAAISSGGLHTCALREDGSAVCWGSDENRLGYEEYGQASPPEGETFAAISSGWLHTCGLREDGAAVCWGSDHYGQASPPTGETFAVISSGAYHTCGLRADGGIGCWGATDLIIPPTSSVARPPVTGPARVSAADRIALDAFYDAAGGDGWANGERGSQGGWSAGSDVRGWHGVTVSETTGRVTGLALPGNNLNNDAGNRALAMLGNLTALTRLDLSGNDLGGALPPELDQLTQLTHLNLSGNAFRGDIHSESTEFQDGLHRDIEWENLQNLVELDLSWNKRCDGLLPGCRHGLSGWIGGFILLPNLDKLDLSGNELHSGAQYLLENAPAMDAEDAGEPVQIDLSDNPWDREPEDLREYWTGFEAEVTRGFVDLGRLVVSQKYPIDGVENPESVGTYLAGKLNEGITGRAVVHSTMTGKWAGTAAWLVRGSKLVVTAGTGVGWVVFVVDAANILYGMLELGVAFLEDGPGQLVEEARNKYLGSRDLCLIRNNLHLGDPLGPEAIAACGLP